jgi:ubiquitin-protein ligase
MTPRLRRLLADFQRVQATFQNHPRIRMLQTLGDPPERYEFEIRVQGLVPGPNDQPAAKTEHRAEVFLPADYPRRPPICRMTTPVFHPNIDPQKICIGDHWSAGQSLAEFVVRIAQMICYQSYNTKSPLNAKAAVWVEENLSRLPLERTDLASGL